MKTRYLLFSAMVLTIIMCFPLLLQAQQQFEAQTGSSTTVQQQDTQDKKVAPPSQHTSVGVMMSENGLEVFSPGARKELGAGEKLVTEPIEPDRRLGDGTYDKKPHGGIRLIGWFF